MTRDIILYYLITLGACLFTVLSLEFLPFLLALLALPTIHILYFYCMFAVRTKYGATELNGVIAFIKMCSITLILVLLSIYLFFL